MDLAVRSRRIVSGSPEGGGLDFQSPFCIFASSFDVILLRFHISIALRIMVVMCFQSRSRILICHTACLHGSSTNNQAMPQISAPSHFVLCPKPRCLLHRFIWFLIQNLHSSLESQHLDTKNTDFSFDPTTLYLGLGHNPIQDDASLAPQDS